MLYLAYQAHSDFMVPMRTLASLAIKVIAPVEPTGAVAFTRNLTAAYELIARAGLSHDRPPFGIDSVMVGNEEVAVHEEAARVTPFGTLLHFKKNIDTAQPRVLLVAPLSGHFATLLRATVRTLLADHDVYITDWHNVRDVPRSRRPVRLRRIHPAHRRLPRDHRAGRARRRGVPALRRRPRRRRGDGAGRQSGAAAQHDPDGRADRHAGQSDQGQRARQLEADRMVRAEPDRHRADALSAAPFRRVYPGFVQLAAFMAMNIERHVKAHRDLYDHLANGELEKADVTKAFYDEYFAVLDLTAEFYLETVRLVFQEHALPLGKLDLARRAGRAARHPPHHAAHRRGRARRHLRRRPDARRPRPLQRPAALSQAPPLQAGVGHYGVFSGNRWTNQIYPILKNVILSSE